MNRVLVVGSVGYDTIETPSGKVTSTLGGSANYFSVPASMYSNVNVVGVVGRDYKESDLKLLRDRKVNVDGIKIEDGETFRWSGSYVDDLNTAVTLTTELNVLRNFNPQLPESYRDIEFVFLANIDPILQMKVLDQVRKPRLVGLDTMNYWIDSKITELQKALQRVDVLLLNEKEALKLSNTSNIVLAVEKLSAMGPDAVVVKRGEYGFFMFSNGRFFVMPAFPVRSVVDPTGAGDSFAGGFFGYLSRSRGEINFRVLQEACVHGCVVASFAVEDFGLGALTKLDWPSVEKRIAQYLNIVAFDEVD